MARRPRAQTRAARSARGSSRACSSAVSRSCRSRSRSCAGKVGRNATSAMIGSASRSRATGTFKTDGRCVEGARRRQSRRRGNRPRRRSRATSAMPAPSSSIAAVRLATPNLPAGSSPLPAWTTRFTCTSGTLCVSTIHTGRPFDSIRFWMGGRFTVGAAPRASAGSSDRDAPVRQRSR